METDDMAERCRYRVSWSKEDNEYVATCVEFPSLSWLDQSRSGAPMELLFCLQMSFGI
jgi:hypothetical protein